MRLPLPYLNLFGVLVLAILCVFQWNANRALHLESNRLEGLCQTQSQQLDERERINRECHGDLERVREQLTRVTDRLAEAEAALAEARIELGQMSEERDQLRVTVSNWAAAVDARDLQLADAADELKRLGADRNDAAVKFNDLAGKHNELVNQLNERTREFNELVEIYNTLVRSDRLTPPP